jgi:phosphoglycolate phosphatase
MKGILFDLDGTLVDTAIDMLKALKVLALENGIEVNPEYEKYKELITYGSKAIVSSIFGELEDDKFLSLQNRYLSIYKNNICIDSCVFPELEQVIDYLDGNNIPWGVVTNKPYYLSEPLIKSIPKLANCKIIVGGDTTSNSKPHPEPIQFALKKIGLQADESWYIGDALTDIKAANAAGMNSAVALWGYLKSTDNPDTWLANKILYSPLEILTLLN